jgi:hypothetical protein
MHCSCRPSPIVHTFLRSAQWWLAGDGGEAAGAYGEEGAALLREDGNDGDIELNAPADGGAAIATAAVNGAAASSATRIASSGPLAVQVPSSAAGASPSIDLANLASALPPPTPPTAGAPQPPVSNTSRLHEWGLGGDHQLAAAGDTPAAGLWAAARGNGAVGGTRVVALTCPAPLPGQAGVALAVQHTQAVPPR